ncbi:MAG: PIG-L deacetylase family protein [Anaerolineae bacterium]|nr:PIG-L deacetylase family protein [Anaerolineae bacterium]
MPDQFNKAMVIVAHPDDPEFFCGGTIARWVREGIEVAYLICTRGDKGSNDSSMTSERLALLREQEQRAAGRVLGVHQILFLDYRDGELEPSLKLRGEIVREVRRFRPDVVITTDPTTRFARGLYPNHVDHRVVGDVTLDALFPAAGTRLYFPEHLAEGLEPHQVREAYLTVTNEPDVWVDTTDVVDLRIAALACHASQVRDPVALEKRIRENVDPRQTQPGAPPRYAEGFRRIIIRR